MDKEIKTFIDEEYKEIYVNLNVSWLKGFKNKKEELSHKGLLNSGIAKKILIDYAITLISDTNSKIKDLIVKSQEKFKFEMPKEEIENYINRSIENNIKYFDLFFRYLEEYFNNKKMLVTKASLIIEFSNAKANNKAELEKIKKELVLINKSKNINKKASKKWLSKEAILVGIIIPIVLFILGLLLA